MPDLVPAQLTPQEQAEFDQAAPAAPAANTSVLHSLTAPELAELSVKDKDNFDLVNEFRQNQDLWANPEIVQKVADAHNLVKQRGFKFSDLPGPKKIAGQVYEVGRGLLKQAWNYANAGVNAVVGAASPSGIESELDKDAQQRVAENFSGTEQAVTGLAHMGEKGVKKIVSKLPGTDTPADFTPEQRVKDLWDAVGKGETEQDIAKGHGGFMNAVGGHVISDLEKEGKGVRPSEVAKLAPGDPFSFWAFGKAMHGAGKVVSAATPEVVSGALSKAGDAIAEGATKVAGKVIEKTGDLTEMGANATANAAKYTLPITGAIVGATKAGPVGVLPGIAGGQVAARTVSKVANVVAKGGAKVEDLGKQVGSKPVVSPYAQLAKDVIEATPGALAETAKGAATDIGVAAVTSESPQDTEGVGLGAAIGAFGGAKRVAGHAVSGQIIAPREYGTKSPVPSSGNFPEFDSMHSAAIQAAAPGVRERLNAVRQFARGAAPGTDVFLAPDGPSLQAALEAKGLTPEQAKSWADQDGFFTLSLPDRNGQPRRVVIAKNVEAAPHEAFHAVQDVLGETANRQIDELVKKEYAGQWDSEGARYAARLTADADPAQWRDTVLDWSGTGRSEAVEKLYRDISNETSGATGAAADPAFIRDRVNGEWNKRVEDATKANPTASPEEIQARVWRDILTPEEQTAAADRYLARELAAENFDMVFKRGPEGKSLPEQLAKIVGKLSLALGGQPLEDRKSAIGQVTPKLRVTEAVKKASGSAIVTPKAEAATAPAPRPPVTPRTPPSTDEGRTAADEARTIAEEAPSDVPPGKPSSPREVLGTVAEAIAQQVGVKINYHSAPGEPAAATSSNRDTRRAIIETFRDMPKSVRPLWEKNFFPERVIKTGKGFQVMGWAPEVFAANAHKLAQVLAEVNPKLSPYEIDPNFHTFTDAGWKSLYEDAQRFVKNQMAGRTGAGEPLVVPKSVTDKGAFAPQIKPGAEPLAQERADFVNLLFNFRLPDSPRVQKGKLPLNIIGQEVSEATKPGRTSIPVRPRGEFTGKEADALGIAGRDIKEVNPLRQQIEAEAAAKGKALPDMIEAIQRLNVENINDVQLAPEQPQFRGNTLTLTAGFQPPKRTGVEHIKEAAVKLKDDGKIYTGAAHFDALEKAMKENRKINYGDSNLGDKYDSGFTTSTGRFVSREEAATIAENAQQTAIPQGDRLEALSFNDSRQFQPPKAEDRKDWRVTVQPDEIPGSGYVQIDKVVGKNNEWSKSKETLAKEGIDVPDFKSLPKGQYSYDEAVKLLQDKAPIVDLLKDDAQWEKIQNHPKGKWGAGLTGWAVERGSKATVDDLASFRHANEVFSGLAAEAMNVKDYTKAGDYGSRAQAASEAYQAATNEKLDGSPAGTIDGIRKYYDPAYKAPLEKAKSQENSSVQGIDKSKEIGHTTPMIQAQPKTTEDFAQVATDYMSRKRGRDYIYPRKSTPVNEDVLKRIADHYEAAKSNPSDAEVQKSYKALTTETLDQYREIVDAGYTLEPWTGKGEPYKSSADMVNDLSDNQHLYYLPTSEAGKLEKDNPMMQPSGIGDAPINDIFRAVHDFFGHAVHQFQFGPKGEFNAWLAHSEMYSRPAQGALAAETLAQNAWVNFGKQVRNSEGRVPVKGEQGFIPLAERAFAEQKNVVIPKELISEARGFADLPAISDNAKARLAARMSEPKQGEVTDYKAADKELKRLEILSEDGVLDQDRAKEFLAQAQPPKGDDWQMPEKSTSGFKKAWITPDGKPVQLGGEFHHTWLAEHPEFGIKVSGAPTMDEDVRGDALKKGFARINYAQNSGTLTIEVRAKDWPKQRDAVRQFIEANLGDIDNLNLALTDPKAENVIDSNRVKLFNYDESEKMSHIPLLEEASPTARKEIPVAESATLRKDKSYNESDNYFKAVAQPKKKEKEVGLPGFEVAQALSSQDMANMTKAELSEHFPEAIVPHKRNESIPSDIVGNPLYKEAGSEPKAVEAFAKKMVDFAKSWESHPVYEAGKQWYSEFSPLLKKEFGNDAPLMAELLAATSPQTSVETNFGYALDALASIKSGRFDKTIKKFEQGLSMLEDDRWLSWYNKELKAGNIPEPPANPTEAAFLEAWIDKHDLKPRQSNGKLYGQHSLPVLQVFARRWLDLNRGPKTRNFVGNLLGDSHEATIDLWADRTMRRLGYGDADFHFAQKVYRAAADELKMEADDLQGALWFAEKQLWADNGWGRLDLGDFRKEMEKVPMLRKGYEQRLSVSTAKARPEEQLGLLDIQPRRLK